MSRITPAKTHKKLEELTEKLNERHEWLSGKDLDYQPTKLDLMRVYADMLDVVFAVRHVNTDLMILDDEVFVQRNTLK